MTTLPAVQNAPCSVPAALAPDLAAAMNYAKAEKSPATRKAYATDFRLFKEWCDGKGAQSLPAAPETAAAFLAAEAEAGVRPSTLGRRVAAIRYAHKLASLAAPTDAEGVKAIRTLIRTSLRIRLTPISFQFASVYLVRSRRTTFRAPMTWRACSARCMTSPSVNSDIIG
jgi:Phage integrase, N-terminal SAM-like domain